MTVLFILAQFIVTLSLFKLLFHMSLILFRIFLVAYSSSRVQTEVEGNKVSCNISLAQFIRQLLKAYFRLLMLNTQKTYLRLKS